MKNYYIKTNRTFTSLRKYGWILTVLIAIGGLWQPKLGLIVVFIMAGLTISGFFYGRSWCGNICPHGSLFDKIFLPISKNKKIPNFLKSKPIGIGFFIFFMINFSRKLIHVFNSWGNFDFLDKLGMLFSNTYLMVLIVGGLMAIFITPRSWCQFCPMGSMQKASHALGKKSGLTSKTEKKVTISNVDKCVSCGKCAKVCPFQLTPYLNWDEDNQFSHPDCIKCGVCIENCPLDLLSLKTKTEVAKIS